MSEHYCIVFVINHTIDEYLYGFNDIYSYNFHTSILQLEKRGNYGINLS